MPANTFRTIRRFGIALACAASVLLGIALVWRFVTREALSRVSTLELLALLGLFVLPWTVIAAVWMERTRGQAEQADEASTASALPPLAESLQVDAPPMRPVVYTARLRRNHRRRVVHRREPAQ